MKNYHKLDLGRTLNMAGPNGFRGGSDCHHYGSVGGCDSECPALWNGECEPINDVLKNVELEENEIEELKEIYKIQPVNSLDHSPVAIFGSTGRKGGRCK